MKDLDIIEAQELESFFDWLIDGEYYEALTWGEFLDNPQIFVDKHFDSYESWLVEQGEE